MSNVTTLIRVSHNYQVTLPVKLRELFHIRPGDYVEANVVKGAFVFKPKKVVDTDPKQAWFWTEEWQAKEREADEDIRRRRVKGFKSMGAFVRELQSRYRAQ